MPVTQLEDVEAAAAYIDGRVHRTPLLTSLSLKRRLGEGGRAEPERVLLKAESRQKTGSFKVRGVLNRIRTLGKEERRRGLVTISAGNHAAALAWGASAEGVSCTVVMPANGKKKPKWSGKSLKAHATVSPLARSSASKFVPSVARMNFALALAVAGLSLSALSAFGTEPGSQVRMWMLLVWRTPPRSDLFDAPARRRLMVVSLLPKASRKA